MTRNDRRRRPPLARTRPIREWSTLFVGADRRTDKSESVNERRPGLEDTVTRSVDLGYRVVDEYIRRGREAAQRVGSGDYGGSDLVKDTREVAQRMIRSVADVVGAWGELLDLSSADQNQASETATVAAAETPQVEIGPWRLRLRVDSTHAVEVDVDLESKLDRTLLSVHTLRSDDNGAAIDDVGFEADSDGVPTLLVRVTDRHPTGVYRGTLVDARSGCRVGTLSVSVRER